MNCVVASYHSDFDDSITTTSSPVPSSSYSISPSTGADIEEAGVDFDDLDMNDFVDLFAGNDDSDIIELNIS